MITGLLSFILYVRCECLGAGSSWLITAMASVYIHIEQLAPCVRTVYVTLAIAVLSSCGLKRVSMGPVHLFV